MHLTFGKVLQKRAASVPGHGMRKTNLFGKFVFLKRNHQNLSLLIDFGSMTKMFKEESINGRVGDIKDLQPGSDSQSLVDFYQ